MFEAESEGIEVRNHSFKNPKIKGLYVDGVITLNKSILETTAEKKCILAEEMGHHHTAYGNILNQSHIVSKKQELLGRKWAFHRLVPLNSFISAFQTGIRNRFEFAEHLGVTEVFLDSAIAYYLGKYGLHFRFDHNITICFDPLGVIMMFE